MRDSAPTGGRARSANRRRRHDALTLGDSDVRMVALIDVTVVQGEPRTIEQSGCRPVRA